MFCCCLFPPTRNSKTVFAKKEVLLSDIERLTKTGTLFLTCNYMFEGKNCIDYGKDDAYCLLNAIPTAEGAIKLCHRKYPVYAVGQPRACYRLRQELAKYLPTGSKTSAAGLR